MSALVIMVAVMAVRTQLVHTSVLVHLATHYHPIGVLVKVILHYFNYYSEILHNKRIGIIALQLIFRC